MNYIKEDLLYDLQPDDITWSFACCKLESRVSFQEKDFDSLKEIMNIEFNPCNSLIDLENDLRSILDTLIKPYDL